MKTFFLAAICSWMAVCCGDAGGGEREADGSQSRRRITLNIEGVACADSSNVLVASLSECGIDVLGGLEVRRGKPSRVEATCPEKFDLALCASKLHQTATPRHDEFPPSVDLVVFAKIDPQSARQALTACHRLHGVDGTSCKADIVRGELHIRITGTKAITPEHIAFALREMGIAARLVRSTVPVADLFSRQNY